MKDAIFVTWLAGLTALWAVNFYRLGEVEERTQELSRIISLDEQAMGHYKEKIDADWFAFGLRLDEVACRQDLITAATRGSWGEAYTLLRTGALETCNEVERWKSNSTQQRQRSDYSRSITPSSATTP